MLAQVGVLASSKSAMKTLAPQFSALMIILRSTGPVISTRRSRMSCGSGATVQSLSRIFAVSGRKSGFSPASSRLLALGTGGQQLLAARIEAALQVGDEGNCLLGKHFLEVGIDDAVD